MNPLLLPILILFLITDCSSAKLTEGGKIRFSIPFDFPQPQKQELREKKTLEKMERLKGEVAREEEGFGARED